MCVYVCVSMYGCNNVMDDYRNLRIEAVQQGAAEWIVDEAGKTTFQWKKKK